MPSRAGLSVLLSFLLVGLASLVLVRPEPSPTTSLSIRRATPGEVGLPSPAVVVETRPNQPPPPTTGIPWSSEQVVGGPTARGAGPSKAERPVGESARWPRPEEAFTSVEAGETLEKVAFRVYGTTEAADHLWQSNRDLLPQRGAVLAAGQPVRTP